MKAMARARIMTTATTEPTIAPVFEDLDDEDLVKESASVLDSKESLLEN
jgi:hypothetical protein